MTSPDKLSSILFSSLLEDSFPQIFRTANQALILILSTLDLENSLFLSFSFCSLTRWRLLSSLLSFSLNNSNLFNLSFYVRFSGPQINFHCSPQGYLHLAPSVKCSVQMGQSTSAELFPMLRRWKHLAFLYVSQSYQHLLFQCLGQQLFLSLRVKQ